MSSRGPSIVRPVVIVLLLLLMIPWAFSHDLAEIGEPVLENTLLKVLHDLRKDLPEFPRLAAG